MLEALKFVRGAVSKKDYQPALTHFLIGNGEVKGYNGTIALASPISLDIRVMPDAIPFVKAIERCQHEPTVIHITPGGKLSVRSGPFKAVIDCSEDTHVLDAILPEGEDVAFAPGFLKALETLEPFIGNDASRPWATGILLRGASAYATNNIIVAQYWIGTDLPEVNLPEAAVSELLRIGEEPIRIRRTERSMTFHYEGGRWMRTQLLNVDWPDLGPILDVVVSEDLQPLPAGFFEAVDNLRPFIKKEGNGRLYFRKGEITTSPNEGEGASYEIEGLPERGAYAADQLLLLQDRAEIIDLKTHPIPCPFQGPNLRGVIVGMVDA